MRKRQKTLRWERDLQLEFVRKDGSTFWLECHFALIRDENGQPASILAVGRDITERVLAEKDKKEIEQNFKLLAENTTDVVIIMDMGLNITWISPSVEKMSGFTPEEERAMPLDKRMSPESAKKSIEFFTTIMKAEGEGKLPVEGFVDIDLEICCKDGSTCWTETG